MVNNRDLGPTDDVTVLAGRTYDQLCRDAGWGGGGVTGNDIFIIIINNGLRAVNFLEKLIDIEIKMSEIEFTLRYVALQIL